MGTTSARFLQRSIDSCVRLGVDKNALVEVIPGGIEALKNPIRRFNNDIIIAVLNRAEKLTGDQAIGFRCGLNHENAIYSDMPYTIQYCKNLRHSFGIYKRYEPLTQQIGKNQLTVQGSDALITWQTTEDEPDKLRHITDLSLATLARMGMWIKVVHGLPLKSLQVRHQNKTYEDLYLSLFSCPVIYGAATNTLIIDKRFLDVPLPTANAFLLRLQSARLERDLAAMQTSAQIEHIIAACVENLLGIETPTLSQVSAMVGRPERSLRRHLQEHGTSFRQILEQVRRERYLLLLLQPEITHTEIARMLGYSEQSALSRAVKKWSANSDSDLSTQGL